MQHQDEPLELSLDMEEMERDRDTLANTHRDFHNGDTSNTFTARDGGLDSSAG